MIVKKFGGTSVKNAELIQKTTSIVLSENQTTLVVVSAFSGVTNTLVDIINSLETENYNIAREKINTIIEIHSTCIKQLNLPISMFDLVNDAEQKLLNLVDAIEILGEITEKSKAYILSFGEILSSKIIYSYFTTVTGETTYIDSRQLIKTDTNFLEAEVNQTATQNAINSILMPLLVSNKYIIMAGFISSDTNGLTTTLGRGGSDYTAAIIAEAVKADRLDIWTDVNGILSSDPRFINNTKSLPEVSYIEASELAYFGAKVLHPKTIYPAVSSNIPVYVKNTYQPDFAGTKITLKENKSNSIIAIAFRKNITIINIHSNRMLGAHGFLKKVFEVFADNHTSVDLVATSEVSISLTIDNTLHLSRIKDELSKFASIEIIPHTAIISAIGDGIRDIAGISGDFFSVLDGINIMMISMGASEVNLSIVVSEAHCIEAVQLLHDKFIK